MRPGWWVVVSLACCLLSVACKRSQGNSGTNTASSASPLVKISGGKVFSSSGSWGGGVFRETGPLVTAARMPMSRVGVIIESGDMPLRAAGTAVRDELAQMTAVDEVTLFEVGSMPEGNTLPGLMVVLKLVSVERSTEDGNPVIKITAEYAAGWSLWVGHEWPREFDKRFGPPIAQVLMDGRQEMTIEALTEDIRAEQLTVTCTELGQTIGKSLRERIEEEIALRGSLGAVPDVLMGEYTGVSDVPFDGRESFERIYSGRRIMLHNDTLWRVSVTGDPRGLMAQLEKELNDTGWKTAGRDRPQRRTPGQTIRGSSTTLLRDERILHICADVAEGYAQDWKDGDPTVVYIEYRHCFDEERLDRACDDFLASDPSADRLLTFWNAMNAEQKLIASQRIVDSPIDEPGNWPAILRFLEMYRDHVRPGADRDGMRIMKDALDTAAAMTVLSTKIDSKSQQEQRKTIDDIAERIESGPVSHGFPGAATFRRLGFVELTPGMKTVEFSLKPEEGRRFFFVGTTGIQACEILFSAESRDAAGNLVYRIYESAAREKGRTYSSRTIRGETTVKIGRSVGTDTSYEAVVVSDEQAPPTVTVRIRAVHPETSKNDVP